MKKTIKKVLTESKRCAILISVTITTINSKDSTCECSERESFGHPRISLLKIEVKRRTKKRQNLYVQYVVMFMKAMQLRRSARYVKLQLRSSNYRKVKKYGLLSTL